MADIQHLHWRGFEKAECDFKLEMKIASYLILLHMNPETRTVETLSPWKLSGGKPVPLPENMYFKNGLLKVLRRKRYGQEMTIEEEFRALDELHGSVPDGFARPLSFLIDVNSGKPVGYLTERMSGRPISWYVERRIRFPSSAFDLADEMLRTANGKGMAHGDIHLGNIMVFGDGAKFIDPIGITLDMAEAHRLHAVNEDRMAMRMLRKIVETGRINVAAYRSYLDLMNNRMFYGITIEQQITRLESAADDEFFTMGRKGPVKTTLNTPSNLALLREMLREGPAE
jgi:hypothetical protein